MSARYRRGVDIVQQLANGQVEHFMTSSIAEVAPDFARIAIEFAFGDLYGRETLDLRSREIAALAALAALGGAAPHLRHHVGAARNLGISRDEIVEILSQTAIYAGLPAALNALSACHDLLTDDGPCAAAGRALGGSCMASTSTSGADKA